MSRALTAAILLNFSNFVGKFDPRRATREKSLVLQITMLPRKRSISHRALSSSGSGLHTVGWRVFQFVGSDDVYTQ